VGTAAAPGSKVWYTVAGGVLSDVYEPVIDNTNVSTLQYVVTDGSTLTGLQTRDMTYTVAAGRSGMEYTVTSADAQHGFHAGAFDLTRFQVLSDGTYAYSGCARRAGPRPSARPARQQCPKPWMSSHPREFPRPPSSTPPSARSSSRP
jgi:hypothetical protein